MVFEKWFLETAIPNNINRIYLEADGGFGKSISLKHLMLHLINSFDYYHIIPIYIEAKRLVSCNIIQYIIRNYCGVLNKIDVEYDVAFFETLRNLKYKYCIIIDGINEVDKSVLFQNILYYLSEFESNENVIVILSSRNFLNANTDIVELQLYVRVKLCELEKEKVKDIINNLKNPKESMINVFTNPMLLSIYLKSEHRENYRDIENESDVFNEFFKEQLSVSDNYRIKENYYSDEVKKIRKFIIYVFLPWLCRFGEILFLINDIKYLLGEMDFEDRPICDIFNKFHLDEITDLKNKHIEIRKLLENDLCIISVHEDTFTIHQKYSSYFQAKYFDITSNAWLNDTSKIPEFLFPNEYKFLSEGYSNYAEKFFLYHSKYSTNSIRFWNQILNAISTLFLKQLQYSFYLLFSIPDVDMLQKEKMKELISFYVESINPINAINVLKMQDLFHRSFLSSVGSIEDFQRNNPSKFETKGQVCHSEYFQQKYFQAVFDNYFEKSINNKFLYSWVKVLSKYTWASDYQNTVPILLNLNDESKSFIQQMCFSKFNELLRLLKINYDNDNIEYKMMYILGVETIIDILQAKGEIHCIDLSDLDLSGFNIQRLIQEKTSNQQILLHNTDFKISSLFSKGLLAIPCIHSDEVKLLWYNNSCYSILYTYMNILVFVFEGISSILTDTDGMYIFSLEVNAVDYVNNVLLYIPRSTHSIYYFNFSTKEKLELFTLPNNIEVQKISRILWADGCEYIKVFYNKEIIYFDLFGDIIKTSNTNEVHEENNKKTILSKSYSTYTTMMDDAKYLFIIKHYTNNLLKDKKYLLGKVGDDDFKISEYKFSENFDSIIAAHQIGNSIKLKEYSMVGDIINEIEYNSTIIDKAFLSVNRSVVNQFNISFFGFDNCFYFVNQNGKYNKQNFENLNLLCVTLNEQLVFFDKSNNKIIIYEKDNNDCFFVKYSQCICDIIPNLKKKEFRFCCHGDNVFISIKNKYRDTETFALYKLDSSFKWHFFNESKLDVKSSNFQVIDSYSNVILILKYAWIELIKEEFIDCDNFNFYNLYNYNMFMINERLIVSSSSLNATVIIDTRINKIIFKMDRTVIYNVYKKINMIICNGDISKENEELLLEYFKSVKLVKINKCYTLHNFENCHFLTNNFTYKIRECLIEHGAKFDD